MCDSDFSKSQTMPLTSSPVGGIVVFWDTVLQRVSPLAVFGIVLGDVCAIGGIDRRKTSDKGEGC